MLILHPLYWSIINSAPSGIKIRNLGKRYESGYSYFIPCTSKRADPVVWEISIDSSPVATLYLFSEEGATSRFFMEVASILKAFWLKKLLLSLGLVMI